MVSQSCCGLCDGDALRNRCVRAVADVNFDGGLIGVCFLLPLEMLVVSLAVLIDVIDDPPLLLFAVFGFPNALANRHCIPRSPSSEGLIHDIIFYGDAKEKAQNAAAKEEGARTSSHRQRNARASTAAVGAAQRT